MNSSISLIEAWYPISYCPPLIQSMIELKYTTFTFLEPIRPTSKHSMLKSIIKNKTHTSRIFIESPGSYSFLVFGLKDCLKCVI